MIRFFVEGNLWLMGILTLLFLFILSLSVISGTLAFKSTTANADKIKTLTGYIRSIALFALVFGLFGQILGLVDIFDYLSDSDIDVASSVLAPGIKITFHSTIYGIVIYLISILISLGFGFSIKYIK